MGVEAPEIFVRIYARHGHRCPMSTLGGRLGLAAKQQVGADAEGLQLVYSNRTCALDGIAEVTGCSEDAGTLRVENDGRHVLTVNTAAASLQFALTAQALEMAGRYRSLCNRLEQNWDALDAAEQGRRRAEMAAVLDELLPQLWQADDAELLIQMETGQANA